MKRRIASVMIAIGFLACLCAETHAWIGPLEIVLPGLPSVTDLLKVIDALTKRESETTVEVQLGSTVSQGKLLVARTRVEVTLERTSKNWRGKLVSQLVVPADISFSVDLAEIRPENIRLDVRERLLVVVMPRPKVEDVTPILAEVKRENIFGRARCKLLDKDTTYELQNTMLTEDFLLRAREVGAMQEQQIREQGRLVLQSFLERILQASTPGAKVLVQ